MSRREHIEQLAAEMGVEIKYAPDIYPNATANAYWKTLTIWDGDDEVWYGTALHELGHIAYDHGEWFTREQEAVEEAEASAWGLDHGIDLTPTAIEVMVSSVAARVHMGVVREFSLSWKWIRDVPVVARMIAAAPVLSRSSFQGVEEIMPRLNGAWDTWNRLVAGDSLAVAHYEEVRA